MPASKTPTKSKSPKGSQKKKQITKTTQKQSKQSKQKRGRKKGRKTSKKSVVIITPDTPYHNKPLVYGHIYSDQCGHCIHMKPEWNKVCNKINDVQLRDIGHNYETEVANLNNEYRTDLKYEGFPTIYRITKKNHPVQYYQGERTAPMIEQWVYS